MPVFLFWGCCFFTSLEREMEGQVDKQCETGENTKTNRKAEREKP